jgi:hypothetical protein
MDKASSLKKSNLAFRLKESYPNVHAKVRTKILSGVVPKVVKLVNLPEPYTIAATSCGVSVELK